MDIGVDALPLLGRGGIARHLQDLLPELATLPERDRLHLYVRTFRRERRRRLESAQADLEGDGYHWHRVFLPDRLLELAWTRHAISLPGTRRFLRRLDVLLVTAGLAPAGAPCPIVGIVHDLVPIRFPRWFESTGEDLRRRLRRVVERSELLLVVSHSVRDDLQELMDVEPDRIRVVHHGIHRRFRPVPDGILEASLERLGVRRPYFLYVGTLGAVKNVPVLLEAFARARRELAGAGRERGLSRAPDLVLAADRRWETSEIPRHIDELGLEAAVGFLGFVDDRDLPGLYSGALATVIPSWYESFGFPALESMACGTPVAASRVGALPELLGEDALFFAPDRPEDLAEQLVRLANDTSLRQELGRSGRERAAGFTWERAARQTRRVLEEAARCGS